MKANQGFGPGYFRYRRRLGEEGVEALRQQVLRDQRAAEERAVSDRLKVETAMDTRSRGEPAKDTDYPPPRKRRTPR